MANSQSQDYELINQLAEEFAERYRRGDHPTLSEYTARHPQLAEEIRELFPALVAIERVEKIYRTPDSPVPPAPFLEQLGDYRILREVGRGGMGIVYEAEQVSLGRRVALKVLPKPLVLDERNQRRFEREARAAAKLHHTNIVPVFGVGEQDGIHYYVMQFIQGLGLDRVLDEIKQMRAAQDEVGNAPHSAGESCPFAPTNVDAAQMARSLMSGTFDRTVIGQCDPVENDPVENDPLKNDPGLSNSIASDPADRQLQVTAAWQLEPIGPAPAGTDSNHAPAAVQTEQFSGLAAPHSSAAPRAETATSRLMDTLSLSGSVDLPGQTGIVTNRNVKRRTYWQSIAHVGVQVAGALAYAHEQGVLHRDIKPGNLLLDVRGTVWVADFGLAKASDQQGLTETGDIMGTLRYMPPEAFTCATDSLGDVYALGLTLYELLALRPAFDDLDRHRLIKLVTTGEPPRLDKLNPQIPRDLVTIVHKAIEREPRQRYQTAQEFADDLSRFLADVPVKARRSGLFERGWRWCRRNQAVAGLLGAVAGLLLAVAVVAAVSAFRLNIEQQATQHQLELTKKAEREATTRLYGSLVDQARANRLSRRAGQRFKSLEVLAEASRMARDMSLPEAELLELRNQAIACLPLFDVRDNQTWEGWLPGSVAVDFDPAFERYARTDREGNVHIHKVIDGGEIWHLAGFGPRESWVYFSPDGRYLHHSHVGKLRLWGLAGANPVLLMERSSEVFAYRPDSEEVACHDTYGMLRRFNLPSGDETSQIQTGIVALGMAYHPEGRLLAISHKAGVQIRDLETGKLLKELVQPGGTAFIKWSPDGKTLATDRGDRVIQLWDGSSGKPTVPLTGHRNNGIGFSFNQTGDLLASSDWDGILRLWDPHTGEQLFQALSGFTFPRFGPNDARLAAFVPKDGRLGIVEVPQVRKFYRTLVRDPILKPGSYFSPSISPDGRLLAVGMADGVGLWSLASGKPLTFVPCGLSYCVLFEPSGALLVSGSASVMRWPIDIDAGAAGSVHIGTPEPLPLPGLSAQISLSRDGQVMAKAMYSTGALVWHRDSSQPPIALSPHGDTRGVAVSPDGRFVATGGHSLPNVKIWDAETGKLVQELILEGMNGVNFSPNGRWLVTTSGGTRIWSTDSWKKVHFIGGGQVAFSADGKIMAVENLAGAVRLINPETGAEYARLEDPHQDRAGQLCFSPDGSQLVTTNSDSGSIHVWNLRAIRAQLAEMGLDWDLPAYPPEVAASGSVR